VLDRSIKKGAWTDAENERYAFHHTLKLEGALLAAKLIESSASVSIRPSINMVSSGQR
jgi:hypothetical protein